MRYKTENCLRALKVDPLLPEASCIKIEMHKSPELPTPCEGTSRLQMDINYNQRLTIASNFYSTTRSDTRTVNARVTLI